MRIAAEHESVLLFYAIQGGNITLVQRVVEIMGARVRNGVQHRREMPEYEYALVAIESCCQGVDSLQQPI